MKGVSLRKASHAGGYAELKLSPLASGQSAVVRGARLLARSGYFSSASFTRSNDSNPKIVHLIRKIVHQGKIPVFCCKMPVFPLVMSALYWTLPRKGGSGKNSKGTFLWLPKRSLRSGSEVPGSARSQIGRLSLIWLTCATS
jgi:hypothetical protein